MFFAPMAFIIPICFFLSKTEVAIVFAMPIPPTSIEMAAIIVMKIWTPRRI